jgi:hydroxylamine dehydrogenase
MTFTGKDTVNKAYLSVFLAVTISTALVVGGYVLHAKRPGVELAQPNGKLVEASGKCAECHARETPAIVHEFDMSTHAAKGITCLDCHQPANDKQEHFEHRGFVLTKHLSAANCQQCHAQEYQQFLRSRHAAPAWAAVHGATDFTPEEVAFAEKYHKGWVNRPPNALTAMEGQAAVTKGCSQCHSVGKPNTDGTIGTCTACHARHTASVELARQPQTCGQCHMGPDHSQIEIYNESKHGVLFAAQRAHMNLAADPKSLTTNDMPVPTCATCHMSGIEGAGMTHDVGQRLSWYLFAPVSTERPGYLQGQVNMQEICLKCHTSGSVKDFYKQAEDVVGDTNKLIKEADAIMAGLKQEGLLTGGPFDKPINYTYFDMWHYYGRTAKHGAFMGGADFVQWHGFFELQRHLTALRSEAAELRAKTKAGETAPRSETPMQAGPLTPHPADTNAATPTPAVMPGGQ